ncbi:hypothetical protein ARMGADRAFT_905839, partial [Armillaria gallica]
TFIPVKSPTWGLREGDVKATWLTHTCILVDLPFLASLGRGIRVLFDPVFRDRCS